MTNLLIIVEGGGAARRLDKSAGVGGRGGAAGVKYVAALICRVAKEVSKPVVCVIIIIWRVMVVSHC